MTPAGRLRVLGVVLILIGLAMQRHARADVVIEVMDEPRPTACPLPEPAVVKNRDGTYTRLAINSATLQMCYLPQMVRREVWTDYPERGGTFIRSTDGYWVAPTEPELK